MIRELKCQLLLWDRRSPSPKVHGCLTRKGGKNASLCSNIRCYEPMTYIYFQVVEHLTNSRMSRLAVRLTGLRAQTYMSEDAVGTCGPACWKLLMESENIVLFHTINVKLFLSVNSVIE